MYCLIEGTVTRGGLLFLLNEGTVTVNHRYGHSYSELDYLIVYHVNGSILAPTPF